MRELTDAEKMIVKVLDDMYLFDCVEHGIYAWREGKDSNCHQCGKQGEVVNMDKGANDPTEAGRPNGDGKGSSLREWPPI